MGMIIENFQMDKDNASSQMAIDDEAICVLGHTQKRSTVTGAEIVIAKVKRFHER